MRADSPWNIAECTAIHSDTVICENLVGITFDVIRNQQIELYRFVRHTLGIFIKCLVLEGTVT